MTLALRQFNAAYEPLSIDETALAREWEPSAYGSYYAEESRPKPYRMQGDGIAVVDVRGALDTRGGYWWDGYDLVVARVAAALADPAVRAVVLSLDSPGGMAAGNLDAALSLRSLADAASKPLVAHAGTQACSAAYALACVADRVLLTSDGVVGSIGTIATIYDRTEANEKAGLKVRVIRSGDLKADPHPDVPLTDASAARVRARINELGGMFAAMVGTHRPQMGDPLALRGAVVYGADAVSRGLADEVGTLADAVTLAASLAASTATKRKTTMEAAKALEAIAQMRGSLNVPTDDEVPAAVATLKAQASRAADAERQLVEARAELKRRDEEGTAKARATVLQKHRDRLALTAEMETDAPYMATLAGLTPEQLDANLSRLSPSGVTPATKETAAGGDSKAAAAAGATGRDRPLTADEKQLCQKAGITEDEYRAAQAKENSR